MTIIRKNQIFENENLLNFRNGLHELYVLQSLPLESNQERIIEEQEGNRNTLRFFNSDLALAIQAKLKAKKPDITGAFILSSLQSWKSAASRRFTGSRVEGAVYRSLEQIQEDLPWLDRSTIQRGIERLERAFPKDFKIDRTQTRVLNYSITSKLINEYFDSASGKKRKKHRFLSVHIEDAKKHGVLEAVLVRNLEFKTQPENVSNPVTDHNGRIYGEMSAVKLTKPRESNRGVGDTKVGILPFQRRAVQQAISNLESKHVFVEHNERRGFYALDRGQNDGGNDRKKGQNQMCPNATVECPNATVVCSNATNLCTNATVSSVHIEIERNESRNEIESDNERLHLSPLARVEVNPHFEPSKIEEFNQQALAFDSFNNSKINRSGDSLTPSLQSGLQPCFDSTPVHLPRFFKDEFPDLMIELNRRVQMLQDARKTSVEHTHPDNLPFDYSTPHSGLFWLENELFLNPITDQPIDWSDFDEQISIAVDELEIRTFFREEYSKEEMQKFRDHFKAYEGLDVPIVKKMLDRISDVNFDPEYYKPKCGEYDHYYFARRIKTLKHFNRYFKQLFKETFAPFIDEHNEPRIENGIRLRWWPVGESFNNGEFDYPLTDSSENMEEPFRTILLEAVEEEREKLSAFEQSRDTIGDAQDRGEIELQPTDTDLLSGLEMDAFWNAVSLESQSQRASRSVELLPKGSEFRSLWKCQPEQVKA
jgi:cation transport regulator ChaB